MPCRFWPLKSFSQGRAMSPVSATGEPITSSPLIPVSGTVTDRISTSSLAANMTSTVMSFAPVSVSVAISPVRRSRSFTCGDLATITTALEVSTGI